MSLKVLQNSYKHTQTTPSTTWTITHNLGVTEPIVDVWIDNGSGLLEKIIPLNVSATNNTEVVITFSTAKSGTALVV